MMHIVSNGRTFRSWVNSWLFKLAFQLVRINGFLKSGVEVFRELEHVRGPYSLALLTILKANWISAITIRTMVVPRPIQMV